ncbi:MAG: cobalt ECF transporter T component CbiQ [Clostridiales bacterium]|nr:cobalt ECF transporter T component CbiQ [Clostridiales bacterium]
MAKGHTHHIGGMLTLDALAAHSGLRGVSPGLKMAFSVASLLLCVGAADAVVGVAVACSMVCIIRWLGGVPFGRILRLLRIPMLFLVVSCLVILLEVSHAPIGLWQMRLGSIWLCVTAQSLHRAVTLFFQALGAVCCLYFLSTSTPMPQIIEVLRKCHLPELIIELMYLIYRYLFVLLEVQRQMTIAAMTRLGYVNWRRSLSTAGKISGGLLASSFRRSSVCYDAMEARGYSGKLAFLSHSPELCLRHALAAAGYCALLGLLIMVRKGVFAL